MPALRDLTGLSFGRLNVLGRSPNRGRRVMWRCVCSCGEESIVQGDSLTTSKTRSCGCLIVETVMPKAWEASRKHGHTAGNKLTPTYRSWSAMLTRCFNPRCKDYSYYGGRGISICAQWSGKEGFHNFLVDMGERPNGTSLDRYPDNNGNYAPGNCRWATSSEQMRNTRATKLTTDLVQEIRGRYAQGEKITSIWRSMLIDPRLISSVVHGKSWKDPINGQPSERTSHE